MKPGSVFKNKLGHEFKVKKYNGCFDVEVVFTETGYECSARKEHIKSGAVKDRLMPSVFGVGFIGDGVYRSHKNKKRTKEYISWLSMLNRCYSSDYHNLFPTYSNCEVCEEWQDFQAFAAWYNENHPNDGKKYDLDKDIKVDKNKIYGPEFCSFVTRKENNKKSNERLIYKSTLISPEGVKYDVFNQTDFAKIHNLNRGKLNAVIRGDRRHHKNWTLHSTNRGL